MAGLLDFIQGASNAAASNVSAPVDGIAWLLRKAGVPIPDAPVGGSDWMAQKGLTKPANGMAGLLGETAGGLAPILAAAKAPQIAQGLLKAGDNLAAPRTLNPQTGAIVWHGSPHKFDAFDASKIGTGEGSQAYGVGHYTAEAPEVARSYSVMAQRPGSRQFGLTSSGKDQQMADALIKLSAKQHADGDVSKLAEIIKSHPKAFDERMLPRIAEYVDGKPPAYMYKIDLPDDQIAKMLDLEAAVPEDVRSKVSRAAIDKFGSGISFGDGSALLKQVESEFKLSGSKTPAKDAAMWLRDQDIPGLRFKDAGTRNRPDGGTSNFVVFPGNENLLQILERNGKPLNGLLD